MASAEQREQKRRYQEAVRNPVKAFKVGTKDDGTPTYMLRLYSGRTGKLMQYSGTYAELEAIYRKGRTGVGAATAVSSVTWLPGLIGGAQAMHKNKQFFKQLQELAGILTATP